MLSIHYINLNPFNLQDKKAYNEVISQKERKMNEMITDEFKGRVFLKRNKKSVETKRNLTEFSLYNGLSIMVRSLLRF